ncbi:hypothetical protein ACQ86N_18665 [Puia sp. P3]|uniref:hypothetical protein n=1 Tax=Puia sp. P3 TaxID=3423952 RepID=UPI003D66BB2D
MKAKMTRVIDLERPAGFAVLPANIYLTGSATEAGATLASALQMKQTSSGEFEIYTKLTAGTYHFVDGTSGTPRAYYLNNSGGVMALGEGGETSFTGTDKIMRIRLSFNNVNGSLAEVKSIQFWYCNQGAFWFTLPYTGNGVWRYNGYKVTLDAVPWDSRTDTNTRWLSTTAQPTRTSGSTAPRATAPARTDSIRARWLTGRSISTPTTAASSTGAGSSTRPISHRAASPTSGSR